MAASISAAYEFKLEVEEQLGLGLDLVADAPHKNKHKTTMAASSTNIEAGTLTSATSPAVSLVYSESITLSSGSATVDLASLSGPLSTTMNWDTKKVKLAKFAVSDTNTAAVTIAPGTAAYNLFGTSGQVTIGGNGEAGQCFVYLGENAPTIASGTADQIDLTSSDVDAVVQVLLVGG